MMMFQVIPVRRRTAALAAVCLAVTASSSLAQADTRHFQGGPPGVLQWGTAAYWFEGAPPDYTQDAIVNSIPYDNNWVYGGYAHDITILRGDWKFGASNLSVAHDLIVGDFANAEQIAGYHNAYFTFDWDSSHYSNGFPQYQYTGKLEVGGNTIVGKSVGSDGYMTLMGCGTQPTLYTPNVYDGLYGNGTVNLVQASIHYENLYVGAGAGSNGTFVADGAPIPTYNHSLQPEFISLNKPIPTVVIGLEGNGSMTFKNGANTVSIVDGYTGLLVSSMGIVTLGQEVGSSGAFNLKSGSSASAYAMNVGVGGQGTLTLDNSSMLVLHPYSNRFIDGAGSVRVKGLPGAPSSVRLTNQASLTTDSGVYMGTDTTLEVLGESKLKTGFFSEDGGTAVINGLNSNLHAYSSYIGQPDSPNFSSLTVQSDATATFSRMLKTGDNGLVSVFTDASITVGFPNDPTLPGHIQVGNAGVLGGRGVFQADVDLVAGGLLDPGFSPGIMTINGDFNMTGGDILIQIDGLNPGTGYDVLNVTGDLNITGGTIDFVTTNGFVPPVGSMFSFFHAGHLNIGPGVTIYSELPGNFVFDPSTGGGTVAAVPEPASFAALGLGVLGILKRRKR